MQNNNLIPFGDWDYIAIERDRKLGIVRDKSAYWVMRDPVTLKPINDCGSHESEPEPPTDPHVR